MNKFIYPTIITTLLGSVISAKTKSPDSEKKTKQLTGKEKERVILKISIWISLLLIVVGIIVTLYYI
ncbi:MAG: hypothetical protein U9N36_02090 [Euryarchaeota archaeon]|nr:hypothetical protein [Euryarchaeota archaeon]